MVNNVKVSLICILSHSEAFTWTITMLHIIPIHISIDVDDVYKKEFPLIIEPFFWSFVPLLWKSHGFKKTDSTNLS